MCGKRRKGKKEEEDKDSDHHDNEEEPTIKRRNILSVTINFNPIKPLYGRYLVIHYIIKEKLELCIFIEVQDTWGKEERKELEVWEIWKRSDRDRWKTKHLVSNLKL